MNQGKVMPSNKNLKIEQISVFLENRAGRLTELLQQLALARINIRAISMSDTSDFGILRLIVSKPAAAQDILREAGFTLGRTSVTAVEIPDRPGGLVSVLQLISTQQINVEYMYAFVQGERSGAIMIFRFDKTDAALDLLETNGFRIVSQDEVGASQG